MGENLYAKRPGRPKGQKAKDDKDVFQRAVHELAEKTGYQPRRKFLGCLDHMGVDVSFEAIEAATKGAWQRFGEFPSI